jgi:hypothetical protein
VKVAVIRVLCATVSSLCVVACATLMMHFLFVVCVHCVLWTVVAKRQEPKTITWLTGLSVLFLHTSVPVVTEFL